MIAGITRSAEEWLLRQEGVGYGGGRFHLPPVTHGLKQIDVEERTAVVTISKRLRDRQGDVLEPSGIRLHSFRKNPVVLWAHDYKGLPIGKSLWEKVEGNAVLAKVKFAHTDFAEQVWQLVKAGFLNAWSVGFIPLEAQERTKNEGGGYTIKVWELLEYSAVPIPANPEALTMDVRSQITHPVLVKALNDCGMGNAEFGVQSADRGMRNEVNPQSVPIRNRDNPQSEKGVIPYKDTGKEDEAAEWDGPLETREAEVEDLKIMCAWFDPENPDVKQSYKLPHHKAKGHKAVWRGVAAAMGALLGARGGVDIPDEDREGVYSHLAKHDMDFGKVVPEFKEINLESIEFGAESAPIPSRGNSPLITLESELIEIVKASETPGVELRSVECGMRNDSQSAIRPSKFGAPTQRGNPKSTITKPEGLEGGKLTDNKEGLVEISAKDIEEIREVIRREIRRARGKVN